MGRWGRGTPRMHPNHTLQSLLTSRRQLAPSALSVTWF